MIFVEFVKNLRKRKKPEIDLITGFLWRSGWDLNPRAHETHDGFRVFYSQHTLADFEKKCPILRVNALVHKNVLSSPLRLLPTARNARELSERTNRTAIKHNSRKSP